jgi:hypothetical protein
MADHQRDDLKDVPPGRAGSAVLFVVCSIVLIASFWFMSYAFEIGSPLLFSAGLVAACAAFFVPMQLLSRPS